MVNMFVGTLNSSAHIFPFTAIYMTLFHLPTNVQNAHWFIITSPTLCLFDDVSPQPTSQTIITVRLQSSPQGLQRHEALDNQQGV